MSQEAGQDNFNVLQDLKAANEAYMRGEMTDLKYIATVNVLLDAQRMREEGPTPEMVAHAEELSARFNLTGHS